MIVIFAGWSWYISRAYFLENLFVSLRWIGLWWKREVVRGFLTDIFDYAVENLNVFWIIDLKKLRVTAPIRVNEMKEMKK